MNVRETSFCLALAIGAAACANDTSDSGTSGNDVDNGAAAGDELPTSGNAKEDAWNYRNDPAKFARFVEKDFEYKLDALPRTGESDNKPWPDTYWPTFADSTNHRWKGDDELSPLEKYDLAFNNWMMPSNFMDLKPFDPKDCEAGYDPEYYEQLGPAAKYMSDKKGNKRSRDGIDSDGDGEIDECDDESNDGVEFWWGLCHAWVPASMNEVEPRYPVEMNGVTFYPADIKGLLQTAYDSSNSMILGGRCNAKGADLERDEQGRIVDDNCRDTNAGSFHVVLSNMLGRYNLSVAEDRTYDYEVWNQPIEKFEITKQEYIDVAQANALLGVEGDTYKYNDDAEKFVEVEATLTYITESEAEAKPLVPELALYRRSDNYHYILELDAEGHIIGGEWLQGRTDHPSWGYSEQPDFLWISNGPASNSPRINPYISYSTIKELLEKSQIPPANPVDDGEPTDGEPTDGEPTDGEIGAHPDSSEVPQTAIYQETPNQLIPDNDEDGISRTIRITDGRTAQSLKLEVQVDHSYPADLEVTLESGGWAQTWTFDDSPTQSWEIVELAGRELSGTYTLYIADRAAQDEGTLLRWALIADTPQ